MPRLATISCKNYKFDFEKYEDGKKSVLTIKKTHDDERGKTVYDTITTFTFTDPDDLHGLLSVLWDVFIEHASSSVEKQTQYQALVDKNQEIRKNKQMLAEKAHQEYLDKLEIISSM